MVSVIKDKQCMKINVEQKVRMLVSIVIAGVEKLHGTHQASTSHDI